MKNVVFIVATLVLTSWQLCSADVLTPEERTWLTAHDGKIRLAPVPNYPPIDFLDEKGNPTGLTQDYVKLIEERLGFRFEIVKVDKFTDLIQKLKNREIDVTTTISIMEERKAFLDFQEPHFRAKKVIITQSNAKSVSGLSDLSGKRVALVVGYEYSKKIMEKYPTISVFPVQDEPEGIKAVSFGQADAFVGDLASATYNIEKLGIINLRVAADTEYAFDLRMASRNDWPEFNSVLAKGLSLITKEERRKIHENWIRLHEPLFYQSERFWRFFGSFLAAVLAMVGVVLLWIRSLRSQVRNRTRHLEEALDSLRQSERALIDSGQFTRQIITSAQEGIVVYGPDMRYQVWNPYMESISGKRQNRSSGACLLRYFHFWQAQQSLKRWRAP